MYKETYLLHKRSYYHTHALPLLSTCKSVRQGGLVSMSRFISTRSFDMLGAHCQLRLFFSTTIHSLKRPTKEAYKLSHTCTNPIHRVDNGLHCVFHHHTLHRQLIVELLQRFGCLCGCRELTNPVCIPKKPYISTKEPCTPSIKPYILSKTAHVHSMNMYVAYGRENIETAGRGEWKGGWGRE